MALYHRIALVRRFSSFFRSYNRGGWIYFHNEIFSARNYNYIHIGLSGKFVPMIEGKLKRRKF